MDNNFYSRLQTAIRSMDAEGFFKHPAYERCLNNTISGVLSTVFRKVKNADAPPISLKLMHEEENQMTACTDGSRNIWLNTACFADYAKSLEKLFMVNLGLVLHELSHVLFLDGPGWKKFYENYVENNKLDIPDLSPWPWTFRVFSEELEYYSKSAFCRKKIMLHIHEISNLLNDAVDEYLLKHYVTGCHIQGLKQLNEIHIEQMPSMEEQFADIDEWIEQKIAEDELELDPSQVERIKKANYYGLLFNQTLLYAKYGITKIGGYSGDLLEDLETAKAIVDEYREDNTTSRLLECTVLLLLCFWSYIKIHLPEPQDEEEDDETNDPTGTGGSRGKKGPADPSMAGTEAQGGTMDASGGTEDQMLSAEIAEILATLHEPLIPDNNPGEQSEASESQNDDYSEKLKEMLAKEFENCQKEAAFEITEEILEEEKKSRLQDEANSFTKDLNDIHRGFRYVIERATVIPPAAQSTYQKYLQELRQVCEQCTNALERDIQERKLGNKLNGQYYGRLDCRRLHQNDGACFYRKTLPAELDMCVELLLDMSGSMWDENRIEEVRKMAVIVEYFTEKLGIPCLIAGHTTPDFYQNNQCDLPITIFKDFDVIDGNDKYRLMDITARNANRDGMAIRYCVDRLKKRQEALKLLITVSDGRPSDGRRARVGQESYVNAVAKADMIAQIKRAREAGITVFGAAIGEDKSQIESYYGKNGFLDISNLNELGKNIVNLIKGFIKY